MKSIKLTVAFISFALCSVAWASGPRVIFSFEVRNEANGQVKACFTDYAGWSESEVKCSATVAKDNVALTAILKMYLQSNELRVGRFKEGFSVNSMHDSLAVLNCALKNEAQIAVLQKKAKIEELNRQISEIEESAQNRRCE